MNATLLHFDDVPAKNTRSGVLARKRSNFLLAAPQKADARAALRMLEGAGITLAEAARMALDRRRAVKSVPVSECANLFLRDRLQRRRPHTFAFYESRLGIFAESFGLRQMNDVSRAAVRQWVEALEVAELTKRGYTRAIRALWRWAAAQEPPLAGDDVTAGMPVSPELSGTVQFLSVPECEAIIRGARKHTPALALALFAGVRPHEIAGVDKRPLTWGCVNFEERIIRIPPEIAKTGRPRIIEGLPATLWAWLGVPGRPQAPVAVALAPQWQSIAAELAGYGRRCARERKWPHDGMRHSFATFGVALTGDPSRVSLWLGHSGSPAILHRHYRGMASKADGEKFFGIMP